MGEPNDPGYAGKVEAKGGQMQTDGLNESEIAAMPDVESKSDEELEVQEIADEL